MLELKFSQTSMMTPSTFATTTAATSTSASGMSQHLLLSVDGATLQNVIFERLNRLNAVVDDPKSRQKVDLEKFKLNVQQKNVHCHTLKHVF